MATKQSQQREVLKSDLQGAFNLLSEYVNLGDVNRLAPLRGNAVYTNGVALWMMVMQRLTPLGTLESSVKQFLHSDAKLLPSNNKRVTGKTLSSNTAAFSKARKRLPLDCAYWLLDHVASSIIQQYQPASPGLQFAVIDGTTLSLAPTGALRKAFPAAENQHGPGLWPIVNIAVAHDLKSGCAMRPEFGPMYGEQAISETRLACQCVERLPKHYAVMADAGFGIFFFAYQCWKHHHPFLFRLTKSRWRALVKQAVLESRGNGRKTYRLTWRPSPHDRASSPELPADAVLEVRLHEYKVHSNLTLHLVTDLAQSAASLAQEYLHRGDVEIDIRNLKIVMDLEHLRAKSLDIFTKELIASLTAYNLVIQFRRQAAQLAKVEPRRMSFKRTWTTFTIFLLNQPATDHMDEWEARYAQALRIARQDKLPHRPDRQYPREAYSRRPKAKRFKDRKTPPLSETEKLQI